MAMGCHTHRGELCATCGISEVARPEESPNRVWGVGMGYGYVSMQKKAARQGTEAGKVLRTTPAATPALPRLLLPHVIKAY